MLVSFFPKLINPASAEALHLPELLAGIRDGRWAEQVLAVRALSASSTAYSEAKRSLPCFTPSGIFERRTSAGLLQHSGIVGLDLDAKQNPGVDLAAAKVLLAAEPHTYACFASAGGEGLCVLVRIPADNHAGSFRSLKAHYHQAYGLVVDDLSDVSRLRFVSHDPTLYLNEKAELLTPGPVLDTTLSTSN